MTDKELKKELEQFTKQELIEILVSANINRIVERIIDNKINSKIEKELETIDKELAKLEFAKNEYLTDLKYQYHVDNDKELFSKMNHQETMKYLDYIHKINECLDKESNIYDKENERYERKYKQ